MSQNVEVEKVMTLGQRLVSLSDVLTDEAGAALDLSLDTVSLRVVADAEPWDRLVIDDAEAVATKDDAPNGLVSYEFTEDDVLAMREAFVGDEDSPPCDKFVYWWVRTRGGLSDRHPGDGRKYRLVLVNDY